MSTKKRTTKTSSDVKDEFDTVVEKHNRSKSAMSTKESDALAAHQAEVLAKVSQLTPDKVVATVGAVQLDVTKTLSQVSEILVEKTQQLQEVNEAIAIREAVLERLHGVDVVASAIDTLLEQHQQTKEKLETEIAETRLHWAKERDKQADHQEEERIATETAREREQTEYTYKVQQTRRDDHDRWQEQLRIRQREEQTRQEQLIKNWNDRETTLKAQEAEITKLKTDAAEWPVKLEKEVAQKVAIATNTVKRDYEHQIQLLNKDAASKEALATQEITTLRHARQQAEEQIAQLQTKLAEASQRVTEVAQKALESASGQSALAAVQKFASESSSNGPSKRS
jgi:colicin import membrane protein